MSKTLMIINNSVVNFTNLKILASDEQLDFDIESYPWKFKNNSFEKIEISHVLENVKCHKSFLEEIYRVADLDAEIKITSYYYNSIKQHILINQKRKISEYTFLPFNRNWRVENKIADQFHCNFEFTYGYDVTSEWSLRSDEARNFAIKHYNNVPDKLIVTLTKKN